MKAPRQFATLVVAIIIALFAFEAMGQTPNSIIPPSRLPVSLPIGSQIKILEYGVTNCFNSMDLRVWYTNSSGISEYTGSLNGYKWISYEAWKQFVVSNAFYSFSHSHSPIKPSSMIKLQINVAYDNGGVTGYVPTVFQLSANIGYTTNVSSNSFVSAMENPVTTNAYVIIPVTGLQLFQVQVGTNYSYTWPVQTSSVKGDSIVLPTHPAELTTNGVVYLNQWYCMGTNNPRFVFAEGGKTNIFTGFGDLLTGATLSIAHNAGKATVSATVPHGADVTFQGSSDLVNWNEVATFFGPLNTGTISFIIDDDTEQQMFFRAIVQ